MRTIGRVVAAVDPAVYAPGVHELGIAEEILSIVTGVAGEHGLSQVRSVHLEIGPLSGVDGESLRFALDVLAPGTLLQGASVEITVPPLTLVCKGCESVYQPPVEDMRCPRCGEARFDTRRGREMLVTSVTGV